MRTRHPRLRAVTQAASRTAACATARALPLLVLAACAPHPEPDAVPGTRATAAEGVATGVSSSDVRFVMNVVGFNDPEAVRYDPDQDVFFVSNMAGYGSFKDGNGYITRLSASDPHRSSVLVRSGVNGAVLDAPKGMAIHGDTLWVADIDVLRGFDRRTGAPLAAIDFRPQHAVLLNDIAVGPDGTLHVTDTGILMNKAGVVHTGPDRIFAVGPGPSISVVAEGSQLLRPDGITWDSAGRRFLVVSFDPFQGIVAAMPPADSTRTVLRTGVGKLDGVKVLPGGGILFTSWADSSVHLLEGSRDRKIIRQVPDVSAIAVDARRNRLAVVLSSLGRVQLWDLRTVGRSPRAREVAAGR